MLLAALHPLHTSFAQLTIDSRARSIEVSLRVFVDDFTEAASVWAKAKRAGSSTAGYARAGLTLKDAKGRTIALETCGEKRVGDLMWLCFRARLTERVSLVASRILFEKFDDQVNIVQATYDGRKSNLLFAPGDGEKRLP